MGTHANTGTALSLGGLGLGLGKGHAYAATGAILGLSLGSVLLIAAGAGLLVVGMKKLWPSSKKTPKDDQTSRNGPKSTRRSAL